ncbi:MAG: tRNA uridine-5-carboxymethylaminomethyl(34) synthesis GTPase MnmE [Acidobacteriota bacterium]
MYPTDDTIVAVATPPGHGGVGVVRLSGPGAASIGGVMAARSQPWPPRVVTRTRLEGVGLAADALVTFFKQPQSYTGEDVVELSAHASPVVLAALVERAVALGARLAQAGEFTLRAYLNGKLDLVQAEAVRDLVAAVSPAQARAAFDQLEGTLSTALQAIAVAIRELELKLEASMDFPDEGYHFIERGEVGLALQAIRHELSRLVATGARGRIVREGARIVIAGIPNVGKSSLFNAIVGADRAIVAATPGTTRDLVTARLVLGDHVAEVVDTAGVREGSDAVEQEGVRRAAAAMAHADVLILAVDGSRALSGDDRRLLARGYDVPVIRVATKADLAPAWPLEHLGPDAVAVSAHHGIGLATVTTLIAARLGADRSHDDHVLLTNQRHRELLGLALSHIDHAAATFDESDGALPEEFVAADLQLALAALDDVTGRRSADQLLHEIFARFCIGK